MSANPAIFDAIVLVIAEALPNKKVFEELV